ncbi:hypothetical protein BDN72DRAFT_850988 [Pluteus cervinus]|uniref:Uncharacterized protein n=1 Tax=Pluteus cervinus TaxID=181527 RepID=A0ACD3A2I3_9AGAR|nr:hypothetical protein BDN72DRAFT_850988 [Pluteus cervinus]
MSNLILPPEVFNIVISQLKYDLTSLKAASLTCKQWCYFARPFLYKSVAISIRQAPPFPDSVIASVLGVLDLPKYNPKYTTHLTLKSSPHILLTFSPSLSLGLPLDQFTNLHTLTLSRIHLGQLQAIPQPNTFSRRITTLRIHRPYYAIAHDVIKFILAFTSLRCLSLHPVKESLPVSYERQFIGPSTPTLLPPIQCVNARLDLSPGFPIALLNNLSTKQSVKRLSLVTSLANDREWMRLSDILKRVGKPIQIWDFGLKWKDNLPFTQSLNTLSFDNLTSTQSLTLSLLDFSTTHKHALSYVFIHHIFGGFISPSLSFWNLRRLKLSFEPPSTSRRHIKHTLAIKEGHETDWADSGVLDLERTDIQNVCGWSVKDKDKAFQHIDSSIRNVWSLCDSKLSGSLEAFPSMNEVVVEVRGLERAKFVGNWDGLTAQELDPEFEMQVGELEVLVTSLFPRCIERGIAVRVKMGALARVSGIWEDHECEG